MLTPQRERLEPFERRLGVAWEEVAVAVDDDADAGVAGPDGDLLGASVSGDLFAGALPPTDDDVSVTSDGQRLDSPEAVIAFFEELRADRRTPNLTCLPPGGPQAGTNSTGSRIPSIRR